MIKCLNDINLKVYCLAYMILFGAHIRGVPMHNKQFMYLSVVLKDIYCCEPYIYVYSKGI